MKRVYTVLFTSAFLLISIKSFTYRSGPGGGFSNAPGDQNCAMSGCHTGTDLNGGSGSLDDLTLEFDPSGGYSPDSTYKLTLAYKQSGIERFGFNLTALTSSDSVPAGDFSVISNRTQRRTKSVSGKTRIYMEHTSTGSASTATDETEWEVEWTAPSSDVGKIKFYATVNATNNNASNTGDEIYAKVFEISPNINMTVAELDQLSGMNIYPNPAGETLYVELTTDLTGTTEVRLYSLTGELVTSFEKEGSNFSLDLSQIENGLYLLECQNGGVKAYQRVMKN